MSAFYASRSVQTFFAAVVALNFLVSILEKSLPEDHSTSETQQVFWLLELTFVSIFSLELLLNMSANLVTRFTRDPWNIFDSFVVAIAVLSLVPNLNLPGLSVLRLVRVFRVVRLFRKVHSFRIIVNSLVRSIIPVLGSTLFIFVTTAIYAILGVELYGKRSPDFARFHQSIFTMYQVATGDSWAGAVARSLFYVCLNTTSGDYVGSPSAEPELGFSEVPCGEGLDTVFDRGAMVFFASFSILSGMILLNVIIAVLLDNFQRCFVEEEEIARQDHKTEMGDGSDAHFGSKVLDPVLEHLAQFESLQNLQMMLVEFWQRINMDDVAQMSYEAFRQGLKSTNDAIWLSPDDWDFITCNGQLCTDGGKEGGGEQCNHSEGEVDFNGFVVMMKRQTEMYALRQLALALEQSQDEEDDHSHAVLSALKFHLSRPPTRDLYYSGDSTGDLPEGSTTLEKGVENGKGKEQSHVTSESNLQVEVLKAKIEDLTRELEEERAQSVRLRDALREREALKEGGQSKVEL